MHILAKVLISLIAALHLYIAWFEIFAWTTRGPVVFSTFPADLFEPTITLAANQGSLTHF
jgi:putative membrane protein